MKIIRLELPDIATQLVKHEESTSSTRHSALADTPNPIEPCSSAKDGSLSSSSPDLSPTEVLHSTSTVAFIETGISHMDMDDCTCAAEILPNSEFIPPAEVLDTGDTATVVEASHVDKAQCPSTVEIPSSSQEDKALNVETSHMDKDDSGCAAEILPSSQGIPPTEVLNLDGDSHVGNDLSTADSTDALEGDIDAPHDPIPDKPIDSTDIDPTVTSSILATDVPTHLRKQETEVAVVSAPEPLPVLHQTTVAALSLRFACPSPVLEPTTFHVRISGGESRRRASYGAKLARAEGVVGVFRFWKHKEDKR